jgi:hypothetical protein
MEQPDILKNYRGKATYQIMVQGKVEPNYLNRLNNLSVTHSEIEDKVFSTLTGEIADQEALSGIISILIDHQYSVISVMKIAQ